MFEFFFKQSNYIKIQTDLKLKIFESLEASFFKIKKKYVYIKHLKIKFLSMP